MNTSQNPQITHLEVSLSVSKAFMAQALGVAFDSAYYFDPFHRHSIDLQCQDFLDRTYPEMDALFTESNLGRKKYYERSQILVGGIQPNMIIGMLLGADFIPMPGSDADITPYVWANRPTEDLPDPSTLTDHPLIRRFDDQIHTVMENGSFRAIPPFFWDASGRAAIHGTLTTAQKFLGEEVFLDMLAEPDRIRRVMDWITDANIVLVRHFADLCKIPVDTVHVGECSSCMIGAREWGGFVLPNLNKIAANLGRIRLHSCGPSNHILESARGIDRLFSLDLGGDTSLGKVRDLFGSDFRISIAPPVKILAHGTREDLFHWTRKILDDNRGGDLTLVCHIEPQYSMPVLQDWIAWLRRG